MTYATMTDFPAIEAPPLAVKPAPLAIAEPAPLLPVSIKDAVLAQFAEAEATVVALAEKYRRVAFDVTTTKGMNEAKAARLELREKGRFAVQRAEKSVKADVNDLKRVMADEVERIVAIVLPVEEAIDQQIKAEEDRKAAAKAERDRIEAERIAAHQAGIAKIRGYLTRCQEPGMTSARIGTGILLLEPVTFGPEWQEFAEQAMTAKTETLAAMRELHAKAVDSEAAAIRAEVERIEREAELERRAAENARIAAELAEQKRALDAQAAEVAARLAEAEALRPKAAEPAPPVVVEPAAPVAQAPRLVRAPRIAAPTPEASEPQVIATPIPPEADLFGLAPSQAAPAADPVVELMDCREALREALRIVQELVTGMDQSKADNNAPAILARVALLRKLGGI